MTRVDLIRELYQTALSRHGENAGSTRMLKAQLDRVESMLQKGRLDSPLENHFLIGSWARDEEAKLPPEDEEDSPGGFSLSTSLAPRETALEVIEPCGIHCSCQFLSKNICP